MKARVTYKINVLKEPSREESTYNPTCYKDQLIEEQKIMKSFLKL